MSEEVKVHEFGFVKLLDIMGDDEEVEKEEDLDHR